MEGFLSIFGSMRMCAILVRPVGCCPADCLAWQNFNIGYCMQTFQSDSFILVMIMGTIDFYIFPLSVTLAMTGSQRSAESYTCSLHFLAHVSSDLSEIGCSDKTRKVEHHDTTFEWNLLNQAKSMLFHNASTMHALSQCIQPPPPPPTPLRLCIMLDTTELNILIPVGMTLTFNQWHNDTRKLELVQSFCCKVAMKWPKLS